MTTRSIRVYIKMTTSSIRVYTKMTTRSIRVYIKMTSRSIRVYIKMTTNSIRVYIKMTTNYIRVYIKMTTSVHKSRWWIQNISAKITHISDKFIRNFKSRIYSLPIHVHKQQLYWLEQHSDSFKKWSAIIRINTEGNLTM